MRLKFNSCGYVPLWLTAVHIMVACWNSRWWSWKKAGTCPISEEAEKIKLRQKCWDLTFEHFFLFVSFSHEAMQRKRWRSSCVRHNSASFAAAEAIKNSTPRAGFLGQFPGCICFLSGKVWSGRERNSLTRSVITKETSFPAKLFPTWYVFRLRTCWQELFDCQAQLSFEVENVSIVSFNYKFCTFVSSLPL